MRYLMFLFERTFYKDLKALKYLYPIKIYNVLKFEFPAILLLEISKTPIL